MAQMVQFEFNNHQGVPVKTKPVKRGVEGLTDMGIRTMVIEYEKIGYSNIKVFLDGEEATQTFVPTVEDKEVVRSYSSKRSDFYRP